MDRFFGTPKRTVISTTFIAVIILAISSVINTALNRNSHSGEEKSGAAAMASTPDVTGKTGDSYIGSEFAKAIALEHANLTANDVLFLRTELDRDDGIMIYEVSFYLGRTGYEYAIDAVTGDIIGYDIDRD